MPMFGWVIFFSCVATLQSAFTDTMVAACAASLAAEMSPEYFSPRPRLELVRLADEQGWVPSADDLVANKKALLPVLTHVPSTVPGLLFLMMTVLLADTLLDGRVCGGSETLAFKCSGSSQC
jgi:hypothetical protein